jgi:hypothetical protein
MPVLSERENVIVLADEAHCSQYDSFARSMMNALPNAVRIGFTGTPIEHDKPVAASRILVRRFARGGACVFDQGSGEASRLGRCLLDSRVRGGGSGVCLARMLLSAWPLRASHVTIAAWLPGAHDRHRGVARR